MPPPPTPVSEPLSAAVESEESESVAMRADEEEAIKEAPLKCGVCWILATTSACEVAEMGKLKLKNCV